MTAISDRAYTDEQILAIGGRDWRRPGIRRIYLSGCAELAGLEIDTYRSGGIKSAWLVGERISNAKAAEIRYVLDRVWWDPQDGRIHVDLRHVRETAELHQALDRLADEIARRVDALADEPADDEQPSTDPVHRVAELRQRYSAREIAAMIGCAVTTVYWRLRGQHRPSARYATAILAIA